MIIVVVQVEELGGMMIEDIGDIMMIVMVLNQLITERK